MTFADLTIIAGVVHSRRRHESRALARSAVEECRGYLARLNAGERLVPVEFPGLDFAVRLGLPEQYREAPGNEFFFCVGAVGQPPFQYNLTLASNSDPEAALWGLVTLLGISQQPEDLTLEQVRERITPLLRERPLLATALLPLPTLEPDLIMVAADFATCFAAAWLEEQS